MRYDGNTAIAGVPGTAAPIEIDFRDTAGSVCESLLPTGNPRDVVAGIEVTCIDNGMPVVVIPAAALGKTGYESPQDLDADREFKQRLEQLRARRRSADGPRRRARQGRAEDDLDRAASRRGTRVHAHVHSASMSRRDWSARRRKCCNSLRAARVGSNRHCEKAHGATAHLSVEHPSGEFTVTLEISGEGADFKVGRSGILRTARALFEGHALVPHSIWSGP